MPLLYLTSASAPTFMHHLVTFVLLFILFLCDLWYMEMPESVLELTMVWAIVALIFFTMGDVVHPLLTAAGIGGFFLVQYLVSSGRWIGSGDIFFGVAMGLLLGWPLGIAALVLAYVLGASIGGVLLATGRMRRGAHMPLGSFLTAATFLVHTLADWMPAVFDRISL